MAWLLGGGDYLRLVRIVGASALVTFAFFFCSLDPFLRAAPVAATAIGGHTPTMSVNRDRKGDRLPLFKGSGNARPAGANHVIWWDVRGLDGSQPRREVPVGCDPAFSPVVSPSLAVVYGRCMT